jgi:ankyrin repeat protein
MPSYLVLGHGKETLETESKVPPGCIFVLAEECGTEGTVPPFLYDVFSDERNAPLFNDPLANKTRLEILFKKPITIYTGGSVCPRIGYTLLNYSKNYDLYDKEQAYDIEPSGIYALPASRGDFTVDATAVGFNRYRQRLINPFPLPAVARAYQGAVWPEDFWSDVSNNGSAHSGSAYEEDVMTIKDVFAQPGMRISQKELFGLRPGIYYNLLCRTVNEESEVLSILSGVFSIKDLWSEDSFDHFAILDDWLKTLKVATLTEAQRGGFLRLSEICSKVMAKRTGVENKTDALVNLLCGKFLSTATVRDLRTYPEELLNATDSHHGYTLLAAAAVSGHKSVVKYLLKYGADPNIVDYGGVTPLMLACSGPYEGIALALLLGGASADVVDHDETTALHIAVMYTELGRFVQLLLTRDGLDIGSKDRDGDTALHVAAGHDNLFYVKWLLAADGTLANIQNNKGFTALMSAIEDNALCASYLAKKSDLSVGTPLAMAIENELEDLAKELILLGAPVDDWIALRSTVSDMDELSAFLDKIIAGGPGTEPNAAGRGAMARCLARGKQWLTRRCLKPCRPGQRRNATLRCVGKI